MINKKEKLEDYTEEEFLTFIESICEPPTDLADELFDAYVSENVKYFVKITEHPSKSDLIFYPREGIEDSARGILKELKEWREKNGKPGFKSS